MVDDVVTFPGRMYAFVNYRSLEEAVAAYEAMQAQVVSARRHQGLQVAFSCVPRFTSLCCVEVPAASAAPSWFAVLVPKGGGGAAGMALQRQGGGCTH